MSTTASGDGSLLDAAAFFDALGQSGGEVAQAAVRSSASYDEALDALEWGLPIDPNARQADVPHHLRAPLADPYVPSVDEPVPAEMRVSFMAATLILVACVTAGAATAAFVFRDRVAQITALRSANR